MSHTFKLYRLQQIDSKLDQNRARIAEIEEALKDTSELQQAEAAAEQAEEQLEEDRKALRKAEWETQDQRQKIKKTETRLYSGKVKNPKELEDLQNESAALKRYLSVLEERQLEAMLAVDDSASEHRAAQTRLEETRAQTHIAHSRLKSEMEQLQSENERLRSERKATASTIDDKDLTKYKRLKEKRGGVAVAKVTDKSCSACGNVLSSSHLQDARSQSTLTQCDTCGRILYAG